MEDTIKKYIVHAFSNQKCDLPDNITFQSPKMSVHDVVVIILELIKEGQLQSPDQTTVEVGFKKLQSLGIV